MKNIDKSLDSAWSELVKIRARMCCEYCGKTTTLNSHHIFSRSNKSIRWDVQNGICLCVAHHVFSSKFSAHKTGVEFTIWLTETRGQKFIDLLRIRANCISNLHKFEKEVLLNELNKEINK